MDAEFFAKLGEKRVPGSGVNAATVPGAVAGYDALLTRFGTMSFRETFARAAQVADEGWGLAERRHADVRSAQKGLAADAESRAIFLDGDAPPPLYGIIRNPNLAKALRLLQAQGKDAFYKGDIAAAIVAKVQANGGVMSREDLATFEPEWVERIATEATTATTSISCRRRGRLRRARDAEHPRGCMPKLGVTWRRSGRRTRWPGT